ncbi:MAG: light-harvesting protein [Rhodobacteraceae bacterium]|nr:MAG: light-harvesting protein [Paracoccaceae bacterium]
MAEMKSAMNRTGLTDDECKEVAKYMVDGAKVFGAFSLVAHFLVYAWTPWF